MSDALAVWGVVLVVGLAAHPIAAAALAPLPGAAAGLARPLGLLLAGIPLWVLVSAGLLPYSAVTGWLAVGAVAAAGAWLAVRRVRARGRRLARRDLALLAGSEVVFTGAFMLGLALVAHYPDVWGTERPLDMALVNAVNEAPGFPPPDPWLSGYDLNYYYLGQYLMALVIRLAGVGPTEGYNVCVALVWALSASAAFGLGGIAAATVRGTRGALAGAAAAAGLTVVGGSVMGAWTVLTHDGPLRALEWFSVSRVVPGNINDFPFFELLVADLHAHVIAVPLTFLTAAFALHAALHGPQLHPRIVAAGLALGALYPVNSWSAPAGAGLLALAGLLHARPLRRLLAWGAAVAAVAVAAYLPFHLTFEPAGAQGIELVPERRPLGWFLRDMTALYGFALALGLAAIGLRLRGRALLAAAAGLALALPLALVDDLGGPAILAVLAGASLWLGLGPDGRGRGERFGFLLVAAGLGCALVPEIVYVRDAFAGSDFYRSNTMFKVGWNAWLLLGAGAAVLLAHVMRRPRRWAPVLLLIAAGAATYPIAGTWARTGGFAADAHLDGLRWLAALAPGDPGAIEWLRTRSEPGAVVLEAHGPEYSPRGHARISTFTGRPTILGWAEHELFYRDAEELGTRARDVVEIYTSPDPARARELLARYDVEYVVVGPLERETYPGLDDARFATLGRPVFARAGTTVYRIGAAGG